MHQVYCLLREENYFDLRLEGSWKVPFSKCAREKYLLLPQFSKQYISFQESILHPAGPSNESSELISHILTHSHAFSGEPLQTLYMINNDEIYTLFDTQEARNFCMTRYVIVYPPSTRRSAPIDELVLCSNAPYKKKARAYR